MRNTLFYISLFIFTASLQSCFSYQEIEFSEVRNYSFDPSSEQAVLKLEMQVNNPNSFGFKVKKGDLDVLLNNKKSGNLKLDQKIKVKKKSNDTHEVVLVGDRDKLINAVVNNVGLGLLSNSMELGLKGKLKVSAFFFFWKKFKLDWSQRVSPSEFMSK